ncbi:MAG: SLC13 family permease [Alphaproteobacteria bacterium]
MTANQIAAFAILALALGLFAWGRFRHDVVAVTALIAVALAGLLTGEPLVAQNRLLEGFGHPAVITVAAVLVISRALSNSGVVDLITAKIRPLTTTPLSQIVVLSGVVAVASAFMNNVGALAILLPVALASAREKNLSPALLLMPLAFGSILGGLMTMIGTPPNIIIATFRAEAMGEPFRMFDFAPVGVPVALAGVVFMGLIGWRFIPRERIGRKPPEELFEIEHYIAEAEVGEDSDFAGKPLHEVDHASGDDVLIAGVVPAGHEEPRDPRRWHVVRPGDRLLLRADPKDLAAFLDDHGLELAAEGTAGREKIESGRGKLMEAVVTPGSPLEGRPPNFIGWRSGYTLRILALGRAGQRVQRLKDRRIQAGDILLLQGAGDLGTDRLADLGLLPLPERNLRLGEPRRLLTSTGIFAGAILLSALGVLPIAVSFLGAVLVYVLLGILNLRELYRGIDWSVIVLLGAMIPVGQALQNTGTTDLMAQGLLGLTEGTPPWVILMLIMVVTMFLSDLVNNAATALIMAPIAMSVAQTTQANADPFLMSVAVGASCAFLTPIGHQSNTLVMGPGGYHFWDYWRVGLPLEVLIVAVSIPMILLVWPPH